MIAVRRQDRLSGYSNSIGLSGSRCQVGAVSSMFRPAAFRLLSVRSIQRTHRHEAFQRTPSFAVWRNSLSKCRGTFMSVRTTPNAWRHLRKPNQNPRNQRWSSSSTGPHNERVTQQQPNPVARGSFADFEHSIMQKLGARSTQNFRIFVGAIALLLVTLVLFWEQIKDEFSEQTADVASRCVGVPQTHCNICSRLGQIFGPRGGPDQNKRVSDSAS